MTARLFAIAFACAFLLINSPAVAAEMPAGQGKTSTMLFGAREKETDNINTFYKWTDLLERYGWQQTPALWQRDDDKLRTLPLTQIAAHVNRVVNSYAYIPDAGGGNQVWKTPQVFFARGGGSCQDFAIAKFLWLEHLGVPQGALRLAIVYDKRSGEPHAVTLVYDDSAILVLDNQDKRVRDSRDVTRYAPIYSINREAWWRQSDDYIRVDATGNVTAQNSSRRDSLAASGR